MNEAIRTQISAYVDGELPQNEAELLLRRMCQDRELRQQAAEYLALGRAMRGERVAAGAGSLRDRISAALDDTSLQQEEFVAVATQRSRLLRPLTGVAIAATVAIAAIVGLQQMVTVPSGEPAAASVAGLDDSAYTVPEQADDQLRDYFMRHNASSSEFGANSINTRLVNLQLYEEVTLDGEAAEAVGPADDVESLDADDSTADQTP